MKFKSIIKLVLVEASKKDILMTKLGVNEKVANQLVQIFGPLAIIFGKKLIDHQQEIYKSWGEQYKPNQDAINNLQVLLGSNDIKSRITSIIDWIRIGLNGNFRPYQEFTFNELFNESERWHESLNIGDSKIDYIEENNVIIDYREDGLGFYWVSLGVSKCSDEEKRMGHCGSTRGILYSLRQYKKMDNKHTLNRSFLTASIDSDGNLLQLKGPKNAKPSIEYNQLILPLFYVTDADGDHLINGVGYEYNSSNDFKISDLTTEEIKKLYENRPEIFSKRQESKLLKKLGITHSKEINYNFTLHIDVKDAEDYLNGEYTSIVTQVLNGDTYDLWDNYEYAEWESAIDYEINNENSEKIVQILKTKNPEDDYFNNPETNFDLKYAIEEYDDGDIVSALKISINDAETHDYENHLYKELHNSFSELGVVKSMNDEGIVIDVDLEYLIDKSDINDDDLDEIMERCEGDSIDALCLFAELFGDGYIEKCRFDLDDRWHPSIDTKDFNEILQDRLYEI